MEDIANMRHNDEGKQTEWDKEIDKAPLKLPAFPLPY